MDERSQEDWLDRQLRETAPYIDDDGFTARVLQKLPVVRSQRQSLRAVILLGITVLASVVAYVVSDGGRFVSISIERLAMLPMLWLFALALGCGILVMAGGLMAAISKTREVQS